MRARLSIKQAYQPSPEILAIMESFRLMVNDCIRIGLENDASSLKRLSQLSYGLLKRYEGYSQYRLTAISKGAGILSARRKSTKRGYPAKRPYCSKPMLVGCYGFKIEDGKLRIPLGNRRYGYIALNAHTLKFLCDPSLTVRSFTLTETSLSLCVTRDGHQSDAADPTSALGIDRNLRNVTVGNKDRVTYYDVSKAVEIAENTRSIVGSFKRNDVRIRRELASKYGKRRRERTRRLLHPISKKIVKDAKANGQLIVFEDIRDIRRLFRKRSGQARIYRSKMNSWQFNEIRRQIEYKATWEGVPVVTLTKSETMGTSVDCPRCGERLQWAARSDTEHYRQLWCERCKRWRDRDLVAVLNISRRGWVRFAQSKGEAVEAVKGNPQGEGSSQEPVILRVDASKMASKGVPNRIPGPIRTKTV